MIQTAGTNMSASVLAFSQENRFPSCHGQITCEASAVPTRPREVIARSRRDPAELLHGIVRRTEDEIDGRQARTEAKVEETRLNGVGSPPSQDFRAAVEGRSRVVAAERRLRPNSRADEGQHSKRCRDLGPVLN